MSKKVFSAIFAVATIVAGALTGNVPLISFGVGQFIGTVLPGTVGAVLAGVLGGGIGLLGFFGAPDP